MKSAESLRAIKNAVYWRLAKWMGSILELQSERPVNIQHQTTTLNCLSKSLKAAFNLMQNKERHNIFSVIPVTFITFCVVGEFK